MIVTVQLSDGQLPSFSSSAALITVAGERMLLQKRDEKSSIFFPGYLGLFGGGIEGGEGPLVTIVREIREELSIGVEPQRFELETVIEFSSVHLSNGEPRRRYFYKLDLGVEEFQRIQLREGQRIESFSFTDLPSIDAVVPTDLMPLLMFVASQKGKQINPLP